MSTVIVLQHNRCETLGIIREALESESIFPQDVRTFENQPVHDDMTGADGLILMGGPMGYTSACATHFSSMNCT